GGSAASNPWSKIIMTPRFTLATLILCGVPAGASAQEAGATTAKEIDPQAYAGTWYEIARTPAPFQEQCEGGVTASYELVGETVMQVVNRCDLANGEVQGVSGEAEVAGGNFNTFSVELGQSSGGQGINYVVAAVGEVEADRYPW